MTASPAVDPLPPPAPAPPPRALSRAQAAVFALLCLAGLVLSIELTRIHVGVHTDPSYESTCALSEGVNCETVALSPYAVFAGLPVAVWGILGYAFMGSLAASRLGRRTPPPGWPLGVLLPLTALSVAASAALAFVSATRIASLCVYCAASQAITVALLVVAVIAWRRSRQPPGTLVADALRALLGRWSGRSFAVAGIAALGALLWLVPPYWSAPAWTGLRPADSGTDEAGLHWIGAREPSLTIVEFSDYECPHCRAAHRDIRAFVASHPGVRLVHRHLPLDTACNPSLPRPFHRYACHLAEAAECAGRQGRFWQMNDALFSIQERVRAEDVDVFALAVQLGLDRAAFQRCLALDETAERLGADVREALALELRGTPTFVVGDQVHLGRIPAAELEALVRRAP